MPRRRRLGRRHLRAPARHGDRALRLAAGPGRRGRGEHEPVLPRAPRTRRRSGSPARVYPRKEPPGQALGLSHDATLTSSARRSQAWWRKEAGRGRGFLSATCWSSPCSGGSGSSPEIATSAADAGRRRAAVHRLGPRAAARRPREARRIPRARRGQARQGRAAGSGDGAGGAAARPADTGLPAPGRRLPLQQRRVGLEHRRSTSAARSPAWMPFMSGFGGISVAMLAERHRVLLRERRRRVPLGARGRRGEPAAARFAAKEDPSDG